ncbi:MAG: tail fiber protein [Pseudomonas sp.]|uniref:tail fiber protein n=1 Tax=Pseudomonas sp. TaxID=306 RepID=UPI00273664FA|nr:tail fiber protein [Pseudomonas sp.]MDP3846231.1 tail fiber protein [Pseudomonas sp.]
MANLSETPDYPAGVYQLETSDPVLGGPGGIANRQAEQLGNRTAWLKAKIDAFIDGTVAVLKATRLATARTLSITGAASGSASFDGSANASIAVALADSGAVAGTYPKVTINAKGIVTGGTALVAADIPALDWSKIGSGKPTTLAGYGITDALAASGTAVAADKLATARTLSVSGAASGSASFDGGANANIALTLADSGAVAGTYPKVAINAKGIVTGGAALVAADIPALDWSKIGSGKPTTLGGYGITDALAVSGTAVAAAKLATARTLSVSGAASGSASFDGGANANIALTLADSGAVAGTYPKVAINAKGIVTGGAALVAADIPALDWSKISSGKPTTLGGYGITDALPTSQAAVLAPPGKVCSFAMSVPPAGWLKANGAQVNRATYAALFAAIGTTFGAGDGSTTFNVPDLRGEFVRGWDDGRGIDAGRGFASFQADAFKAHFHSTVANNQFGNFQYIADVGTGGTMGGAAGSSWAPNAPFNNGGGGSETRPRNVALLTCIKY